MTTLHYDIHLVKQQIHSHGEQIEEKLRNYNQKFDEKIAIVNGEIKLIEELIDFKTKEFEIQKADLKDIKEKTKTKKKKTLFSMQISKILKNRWK